MSKTVEIARGIFVDYKLYRYLIEHWSESEVRWMFEAIRVPPRRYYVRVNVLKKDPDDVLRMLRDRGLDVYPDEHLREALWFPVKGPNRVPSARKVVVVDKRAAESVYMGANVYAPGVVSMKDVRRGDEVNVLAPSGDVIAYGVAEVDEDDVKMRRAGLAVRILRSVYEAPKVRELPEYASGLIYDQSLPAQLVTHVLNPGYHEVVVDMCSAPGGKLTHIVQYCRGMCKVYSFDRSHSKTREMIGHLIRLGMYHLVDVQVHDSRYLDVDYPKLVGRVDKVLLDPPCTSLGVRPKLVDYKTFDMVRAAHEYQRQFLRVAYKLLRRGGVLVYSTCTITPLENEDVMDYALKLGFDLDHVDVPGKSISTFREWGYVAARFYPHVHDTPGFFICKLVKR